MQLQIAAKLSSVLCCHLANTNDELGGLAFCRIALVVVTVYREQIVRGCGGCSEQMVSRLMPLLTVTGENGHVEQYTVDLGHRLVRHCTYTSTRLLREFVVPLDVQSPGWSLSGQFIKVSHPQHILYLCQSLGQSKHINIAPYYAIYHLLRCCRPVWPSADLHLSQWQLRRKHTLSRRRVL